MLKKILIAWICSQICILGVFSAEYLVSEEERNLCGKFVPGNASSPNWLQEWWKLIEEYDGDLSVEAYCKNAWYRYAGVPIWIQFISDERAGAEYLASLWVIEKRNLNPLAYQLGDYITRRELMKVIIGMTDLEVSEECESSFEDVIRDWGCKYIETALENEFIASNIIFRPEDLVTKTEALKLIFKARNIDKRYETSFWQEDYISTAYYLGYIDEKFENYNEVATRWWIFAAAGKTYEGFSN